MSAKAEYTPGPYEYRLDRTIAASGLPLARCYADRNETANGRLFAAAPDLDRALLELVEAVATTSMPTDAVKRLLPYAMAAKAALDKVRVYD